MSVSKKLVRSFLRNEGIDLDNPNKVSKFISRMYKYVELPELPAVISHMISDKNGAYSGNQVISKVINEMIDDPELMVVFFTSLSLNEQTNELSNRMLGKFSTAMEDIMNDFIDSPREVNNLDFDKTIEKLKRNINSDMLSHLSNGSSYSYCIRKDKLVKLLVQEVVDFYRYTRKIEIDGEIKIRVSASKVDEIINDVYKLLSKKSTCVYEYIESIFFEEFSEYGIEARVSIDPDIKGEVLYYTNYQRMIREWIEDLFNMENDELDEDDIKKIIHYVKVHNKKHLKNISESIVIDNDTDEEEVDEIFKFAIEDTCNISMQLVLILFIMINLNILVNSRVSTNYEKHYVLSAIIHKISILVDDLIDMGNGSLNTKIKMNIGRINEKDYK